MNPDDLSTHPDRMSRSKAREIMAHVQGRATLRMPQYIRDLHPKQLEMYLDPSRFKVAHPGRRGGKTSVAYRAIAQRTNANANVTCVYMAPTRDQARRLCWGPLARLDRENDFKWKFNKVELQIYAPNGSEIWIMGADNEKDIDKVLGGAYKLVVIDEAASFGSHIGKLIREGIEPALGDHRGELWLIGSPGIICAGFYHDACKDKSGKFAKWKRFHWTVKDNTHFPSSSEEFLKDVLKDNGWSEDHPTYKRQYLGMWVHDPSLRVYQYDDGRNGIDKAPFPEDEYSFILAMDYGVNDATSFTVLGFHPHDPAVVVFKSYKLPGLDPASVAVHINMLDDRFGFECLVGDTGGMGKAYTNALQQRHGITVEPAKKTEKRAFIEHLNGDLVSTPPRLVVVRSECEELIEEWSTLAWKEGTDKLKYSEALEDHCADGALYGWRKTRGYMAIAEVPTPDEGTPEHWELIEHQWEMDAVAAVERARNPDGFDEGELSEFDAFDEGMYL